MWMLSPSFLLCPVILYYNLLGIYLLIKHRPSMALITLPFLCTVHSAGFPGPHLRAIYSLEIIQEVMKEYVCLFDSHSWPPFNIKQHFIG